MRTIRECSCFTNTGNVMVKIVEVTEGRGKLKARITRDFVPMPPAIPPGGKIPVASDKEPETVELEGQDMETLTSQAKEYIINRIGEITGWRCIDPE